jgi:RNA polymerase sigma factor (TIGR02999 family)
MSRGPQEPSGASKVDRKTLDDVVSLAYEELRRLAATVRRDDRGATLNPTALVNEAWIKLASSPSIAGLPRVEFMRIAARAMRQVLVESARRRKARKRGGGSPLVTFDESLNSAPTGADDVLALDGALEALATIHPRQVTMIECRFFGGLDVAETAALLDVSEVTIHRDWRFARAWLSRHLRQDR